MEVQAAELIETRLIAMAEAAARLAPQIGLAILVLLATWGLSKLLGWSAAGLGRRFGVRRGRTDVLAMLFGVGVWVAGLLTAAGVAFPSIAAADVLTALGLGSVAVGLAFRDIFQNFFAGVLILLREPFRIGDYVHGRDGELEGLVENITMRDTRIRRTDGQLVVAPNHALFQNPVTVRTNQSVRRTTILCGVHYATDMDRAREVIQQAVRGVDSVRDDVRDVQVFAHAFNDSSVDFEIAWWTGSRPVDIRASRDEVVRAIKRALDAAAITIPFPQRTLTLGEDARAVIEGAAGRAAAE